MTGYRYLVTYNSGNLGRMEPHLSNLSIIVRHRGTVRGKGGSAKNDQLTLGIVRGLQQSHSA